MNITLARLGLLLLVGAQAFAQNDLRFVRPDGTTTTLQYGDAVPVSIRYDALPNETTLLFAHTTIDVLPLTDVENPPPTISESLAKGINDLYQFLQVPAYWHASDVTSINGGNYTVTNGSMPLAIPAARVHKHVMKFLDPGAAHAEFGTQTSGSVTFAPQAGWAILPAYDERNAWIQKNPVDQGNPAVLDVTQIGHESVLQEAADQAEQMFLSLDPAALDLLDALMRESIGFRIHVQAIHVELTQPPRIRFSQVAVIRVLSLKTNPQMLALPDSEKLPWDLDGGHPRLVPWLLGSNSEIMYLGGLGEYMTLRFSAPVARLMAQVPLSGGGYTLVTQIPTEEGQDTRIAKFHYPSNAANGAVLVSHIEGSGNAASWVQDIPDGHWNGLALVYAYDPNLNGFTWNPDWWNLNR